MARTDTFNNWATDVADSIRSKTGKTDKIPATNFDSEIAAIQTKEDLDAELTVQNEEITEQEVSIEDIKQALNGKSAYKKYAPRRISFSGYTGTSLDYEIANLDTSKLTSMYQMFSQNNKLVSLDLSNFDTSKVTDMSYAFYGCVKLTVLDLSNFDTSKVTNMQHMFYGCDFTKLDIRNFDFTNVTRYDNIFSYMPTTCEIIVKDDVAKTWVLARRSDLTNVKTVAELEG